MNFNIQQLIQVFVTPSLRNSGVLLNDPKYIAGILFLVVYCVITLIFLPSTKNWYQWIGHLIALFVVLYFSSQNHAFALIATLIALTSLMYANTSKSENFEQPENKESDDAVYAQNMYEYGLKYNNQQTENKEVRDVDYTDYEDLSNNMINQEDIDTEHELVDKQDEPMDEAVDGPADGPADESPDVLPDTSSHNQTQAHDQESEYDQAPVQNESNEYQTADVPKNVSYESVLNKVVDDMANKIKKKTGLTVSEDTKQNIIKKVKVRIACKAINGVDVNHKDIVKICYEMFCTYKE